MGCSLFQGNCIANRQVGCSVPREVCAGSVTRVRLKFVFQYCVCMCQRIALRLEQPAWAVLCSSQRSAIAALAAHRPRQCCYHSAVRAFYLVQRPWP